MVGIDQEPDTLSGGILALIRDQFDFGKTIAGAVITFTAHNENIAPFDGMISGICHRKRQTILSGPRCLDLNVGPTLGIRI